MSLNLLQKQFVFSQNLAILILKAIDLGYQIKILEVLRGQAQANANALSGSGIKNSLHLLGLAADVALFKNEVMLVTKEDYQVLGEYWESLSTQDYTCCWGGRFQRPDSDHFSIAHQGIK